jgi:DUF2892 family protein
MKMNEGPIDRVIRVILGIALFYVGYFVVGGTWGIVLDVVGIIVVVTGATGFCLLYRVLGNFTTARKS